MPLGESDTRAKLIDPALHACGWTEDFIRREETAGAVEVVEGQARRRAKGRMDYTLRVRVNQASQPVAVALTEAKAEHLQPAHGLEQAKAYAACRRLNVPVRVPRSTSSAWPSGSWSRRQRSRTSAPGGSAHRTAGP